MTKHKTLHFFWAAFPLSLLILLLQVMPALAQRAAGKPDSVDTWSAGPSLPGPLVRAVGVFFPTNGHFYAAGPILPGGFFVVGNKLYITGGFNINTSMTHQTWVFDPTAAVGSRWTQKADYPMDRGYIPTTAIGNVIYTAGGSLWDGTTIH